VETSLHAPRRAALQADGKIVVVGGASNPMGGAGGAIYVARFTADPPISDANQRFLSQVYLDLLQRPIDPVRQASWSNALAVGMPRTQVVSAIENSQEYHPLEVQYLYGFLLRRPPDPGGLATWINFLNQGGTQQQLEARFLGSDEYFNVQGGTNAG